MSSTKPKAGDALDRGARRRAQTRERLLDAARALFARQGIDATRIQEITEQADVGFGTFYNHFGDKEGIVAVVVEDLIERQAKAVERLTADVEDPAEVISIAHRHFLRLARADPTWGWLLVRLDLSHQALAEALGAHALRDLERGIASGRLVVEDPILTLHATGGALLGSTRAILEGQMGERADEQHSELVLRMLGIPGGEASEISRRPLPE